MSYFICKKCINNENNAISIINDDAADIIYLKNNLYILRESLIGLK